MTVHEYPRNHGSLAGLSGTDHHPQYVLMEPGTAALRPNPTRYGRIYTATDTGAISIDIGTRWVDLIQSDRFTDMENQMAMEVGP